MNEIWKPVVGYEGLYEVSNLGNVRSLAHTTRVAKKDCEYDCPHPSKVLRPQTRRHGYLSVCLYGKGGKNGRFTQVSIHRLVAEAFIPNPENKTEVNHIDENKQNNRADNLEWMTHKENANHGTAIARRAKKQTDNPNRKYRRVQQIDDDGNVVGEFLSAWAVERELGFDHRNVYNGLYQGGRRCGYYWKFIE